MKFRNKKEKEKLNILSEKKCLVCGWNEIGLTGNSLLQSAHLKKFSEFKEQDNIKNLILLCPNHHIEFDNFKFYICPENFRLIFKDEKNKFHNKNVNFSLKYVDRKNLMYRKYLYMKKNNIK